MPREQRLHHDPAATSPWPDQPGGADEECHRPLVRPVAGRQRLAIEVEERHDVGRRHPMEDRFGADVQAGVGWWVGIGAGDRDRRSAGGRGELLGQPRHTRSQVGERRRPALEAHRRTDRAAPAHTSRRPDPILGNGALTALATGERTAAATRQEPCPSRRVEHADHPTIVVAKVPDQRRRQQRAPPRFLIRPVDHVDDRPAVALARGGRAYRGSPVQGRHRRARRHQPRPARPATPATLDDDVTGVPGRAALTLQRLVVLVDHDCRGDARTRRPRRVPRADHDVDTTSSAPPTRRARPRPAEPGPSQPGTHQADLIERRYHDQRRPERGGAVHARERIGRRWESEHSPARGEDRRGGARTRLDDTTGALARREAGARPARVRRRRGSAGAVPPIARPPTRPGR